MIYTIIREKWLRGEGVTASRLLRFEDGKMCCLGQVMEQCGANHKDLILARGPASIESIAILAVPIGIVTEFVGPGDGLETSQTAYDLMAINDNEELSDETREHLLKIEASKLGHTLIFI